MTRMLASIFLIIVSGCATVPPDSRYPVTAEVFNDQFVAAEGITFNGEGRLFVAADRAAWEATPDGVMRKLTHLDSNLGQAGIGPRDILQADFGPTNVFRHGPNDDGVVWRISPDGEKAAAARGIADPNFILVMADGTWLVSDDGTDIIYQVNSAGQVSIWSRAVPYPNGMALSLDGHTLYVAQIFSALNPVVLDNRIWALPLAAGRAAGPPRLVARAGDGGVDGLAMDRLGRIYVADNPGGRIWRVDPESGSVLLIAEGMPHVASLVFGEGKFDHRSIYATSTFRGGGTIWRVPVGIEGAPVIR